VVIDRLQNLFGELAAVAGDRNPERARDIDRVQRDGLALCIEASAQDPPVRMIGPWAEPAQSGSPPATIRASRRSFWR
jgi:hypothetical protein